MLFEENEQIMNFIRKARKSEENKRLAINEVAQILGLSYTFMNSKVSSHCESAKDKKIISTILKPYFVGSKTEESRNLSAMKKIDKAIKNDMTVKEIFTESFLEEIDFINGQQKKTAVAPFMLSLASLSLIPSIILAAKDSISGQEMPNDENTNMLYKAFMAVSFTFVSFITYVLTNSSIKFLNGTTADKANEQMAEIIANKRKAVEAIKLASEAQVTYPPIREEILDLVPANALTPEIGAANLFDRNGFVRPDLLLAVAPQPSARSL